jgi:hypothetical protein
MTLRASTGGEGAAIAGRTRNDPMLDRVVEQLQEIERNTGIEKTLAIGELIFVKFFGADIAVWRDRRRNKNNSIRRLAEREDCPLSKSALNEAVAVYVASRELPCVRTFGHISASHVAVVLRLTRSEQELMLLKAAREHWSVRQLRGEVIARRRAAGERRGRPARDESDRATAALRAAVQQLRKARFARSRVHQLSTESQAIIAELKALTGPQTASTADRRSGTIERSGAPIKIAR